MFSKFSENSQKVLLNAKKEMLSLKHPYVGSEHLLLSILSDKQSELAIKLRDYGLFYESFRNEVINIIGKGSKSNTWFLYTPLLKRIIEGATIDCHEKKSKEVEVVDLFLALLEEGDGVAIRILLNMNIDIDLLYEEFSEDLCLKKKADCNKLLIEQFAVDLNKKCKEGEIDPVIGRDDEINRLIEVLARRSKNNPLLIGDAGVGKTSIVEELASRIVSANVPESLRTKRILSVSMSSLVAGTKYRGEFEERINKIISEIEQNKEIIMFIDEIHTLVGAGGAEGAIDASNILKPSLARGKIKVIGATTKEEYAKYLEKDKALDRRFQKILIEEPDYKKTKDILLRLKSLYESYHNVMINDDIIEYIVELSDRYIHNRKFPDKAIDILDEVCAKTVLIKKPNQIKIDSLYQKLKQISKQKKEAIIKEKFDEATKLKIEQNKIETKINKLRLQNNNKLNHNIISKEMVNDVVSKRTFIPMIEQNINNKKILALEKNLNKKVLGQENAISVICEFTKRYQMGFINNKVHSFLLVGKTGVGKTQLVKEYASILYKKENLIRLDMSEYKESHSISKILGSPPGYIGYDENSFLLEKIKNNPYSILLLDEIEKAHIDVIKLFLQVLDEGKIKDSKGNEIYFNNVIIFMTSNLGCDDTKIGFSKSDDDYIIEKLSKFFSVEFINRIDDILIFNSLSEKNIKLLIRKKLNTLKEQYKEKNVNLTFSTKIVNKICVESKFEKYGARRIDKIIDKEVNSYIINEMINGKKNIDVVEI